MNAIDRNPPAFPVEVSFGLEPGEPSQTGESKAQFPGMTLRDWFAGQALAGYCAAPDFKDPTLERLVGAAYKTAEAMLAERARRG